MTHRLFYRTEISHVSFCLPQKKVTNEDLRAHMDTSHEWIVQRTGICERRMAEPGVSTSDLAVGAVEKLFAQSGLTAKDFDYMIAATVSPDYYFPGIAPILQKRLGFGFIPALDIRVQCSAFVYGMQLAAALMGGLNSSYKRILLVFSDVQTPLLDMSTQGRNVAVLFGDGAGAVACERHPCASENDLPSAHNTVSGFIDGILGSDGAGTEMLICRSPGSATPGFMKASETNKEAWFIQMQGQAVFKHSVQRMSETAQALLRKHNLSPQDIDCVIPHQANLRISEAVREKLGLAPEKVFNNIQHYGNTTSATIPLCLAEALEQGRVKKGSLVLFIAFGAGFTWGAILVRL